MGADSAKDSLPTAERGKHNGGPLFLSGQTVSDRNGEFCTLFGGWLAAPAGAGTAVSLKIGESATATAVICNI